MSARSTYPAYLPGVLLVARRAFYLAFVVTLAIGPRPGAADESARRLGVSMDGYLIETGFEGAFLLAEGSETLLAKGYGFADRAGKEPVTPDTAFWCASVAKQFTAAAVLRLVESGVLELDSPVSNYLVGLPAAAARVSVRHLLTHTAGLPRAYAADGESDRDKALVALFSGLPADVEPGQTFSYTDDAYSVLAILVEVVSGKSYESYLRDELFTRAGMTNSGFMAEPPGGLLAELRTDAEQRVGKPDWGWRGPAGIATGINDLYRWWRALESGAVLAPERVEEMLSEQFALSGDRGAGFGWFQEKTATGETAIWTRGSDQTGESGILLVLPQRDLVVIALAHSIDEEGDTPITQRVAWEVVRRLTEATSD